MEYIINPSWFYWLGVVDSVRSFAVAALIVSIAVIIASLIVIPMDARMIHDFPDMCDDEKKTVQFFTKALKIAIGIFVITGLALVFVPSKETLIEVMIAKQATYKNAAWTVDAVKSAVDYIIQVIQSLK